MVQTLDECRAAWEQEGKHGDRAQRIERSAGWIPYYRYAAQQQLDSDACLCPHAREVVCHLWDSGFLESGASVLDIGSGTGAFTLAFAERCREVTALDMEAASLSVLQNHAAQLGLSNISCIQRMWEAYEPERKFSLSFSSMCPAICNDEELLKMESAAEKACCLLAVTRGSYDLHRKNLMQLLSVRPQGGMTTEALRYYEILYLMGRQPDVRNWTAHDLYTMPVDDACRRYEIYFEIFGIPAEQSRPVLRGYFESKAEAGIVRDESRLNTALISWRPGTSA